MLLTRVLVPRLCLSDINNLRRFMEAYRVGDVAALRGLVTEGLLVGITTELKQQQQEAASSGSGAAGGAKKRRGHHKPNIPAPAKATAPVGPLRSAFVVEGFKRGAEVLQVTFCACLCVCFVCLF